MKHINSMLFGVFVLLAGDIFTFAGIFNNTLRFIGWIISFGGLVITILEYWFGDQEQERSSQ